MKSLILILAVMLAGCGESSSSPSPAKVVAHISGVGYEGRAGYDATSVTLRGDGSIDFTEAVTGKRFTAGAYTIEWTGVSQ